jgi:DNA-binding transcriptional ArsR family regulator
VTPDLLFGVLGNRIRREILSLTADEEWCISDLAAELKIGQPGMTRHVKKLSEAGLVEKRDSLAEGGGKVTAVRANVPELERLVTAAVRACHPYGIDSFVFKAEAGGEETRTWK